MSFQVEHRRSEAFAAEAELALAQNRLDDALALYSQAADAERRALAFVPDWKGRTAGIIARSTLALLYKAKRFKEAHELGEAQLARHGLPPFARNEVSWLLSNASMRAVVDGPDPLPPILCGEAMTGEGDELAHIDAAIGPKTGPVGGAFVSALSRQADGHSALLALVSPNLPCRPDTLLFNRVTLKSSRQVQQLFGPAQAAVARAVMHCVENGVIPRHRIDEICLCIGVFIHWSAQDDVHIFTNNFAATRLAVARALSGSPTVDEVLTKYRESRTPAYI